MFVNPNKYYLHEINVEGRPDVAGSEVPDGEIQYFLLKAIVRRHKNIQGAGEYLIVYCSCIGKRLKSKPAMTFSDTAEIAPPIRKMIIKKMNATMVNTGTSGAGTGDQLPDVFLVSTKNIHRKRFFPAIK